MRWQVYRLARLIGKVVRFQHRRTHWWAAPLYQKQRNLSGLTNWLGCLAPWYTSNFNLCILLKAQWAVSFCWLPPVLTSNCDWDLKKGIQWVSRGKERLPHNRLNPSCYMCLHVFAVFERNSSRFVRLTSIRFAFFSLSLFHVGFGHRDVVRFSCNEDQEVPKGQVS